jgi:hypothetical protein
MHVPVRRIETESEELNGLLTLGVREPVLYQCEGSARISIALTSG